MEPNAAGGMGRRDFVKAAVAAGGAAALSACLAREEDPDLPTGPEDLSTLPDAQHAWNGALPTDDHGNDVAPRHHLLLYFDYAGDGTPDDADRETVEAALQSLERAYARSQETDDGREVGLVFTVGYSPAYFDRFEASLSESVDLPEPAAMAPFEDPEFEKPDVAVHLASDYGSAVLGAEEALRGEKSELNGVEVTGLDGVLERVDRRTGFVGDGLPAEHDDVRGVPEGEVDEDSPLYMGFKSGFSKNQASERRVTIREGPFGGGTTQHVSMLRLHLDQWYEQDDRSHRVATMFCPVHAEEDLVEGVGENLGDSSLLEERGCPAHTEDHAREYGKVGHSQKSARAREDGDPIILRRDFDSTDDDLTTLHFVSLQRAIEDFRATREAMNGTDVSGGAVGQRTNNGILQYMTVKRRANFLLPPRRHRSLPPAVPE
ncbi:Tat pathway signal protein [Halobacteriales archaeon QS_1_68_20]|nr:MAG: Tat pathway signal protein [Halobacteriales archaeon QS_1_68_20]